VAHIPRVFTHIAGALHQKSKDWSPDTGADTSMEFKLNVCHTVLSTNLDVKYPDNIASWGKKNKGASLG